MTIRPARVPDVPAICDLVNSYAERGIMLHRSRESIYEALREFLVAEDDAGRIIGCAALDVYWANLAEIRSLAVAADTRGMGVGRHLVEGAIEDAHRLGITRVCAMTYEEGFFEKLGFQRVPLRDLPEKIWRECLAWYADGHRHETAMLRILVEEAV